MRTLLKIVTADDLSLLTRSSELECIKEITRQYGHCLLQGHCASLEDFISFSELFKWEFRTYNGGATVRESAVANKTIQLVNEPGDTGPSNLHGEQYYLSAPPKWVIFYCETPAESGGETLVCDGSSLFQAMPPRLKSKFLQEDIVYVREFSHDAVKKLFGSHHNIPPEWHIENGGDGGIVARYRRHGLNQTPEGESVFINSILPIIFDFETDNFSQGQKMRVEWESGEAISVEEGWMIRDAAEIVQQKCALKRGDVLIVDNQFFLHGRTSFCGLRKMHSRLSLQSF